MKISRLLAQLHQVSYLYLGPFASAAEGGLHPKHRLMNYHNFFVENVDKGDTVLDVGCGNGALLEDIVMKTKSFAVGVEISDNNVRLVKERFSSISNVHIIRGDIWEYRERRQFNNVVLSNVLEHLDRRPELLKYLNVHFRPRKFLIRVPMFEREWVVPYKKEIGVEWRLDSTHLIEYTEEEFCREIARAGLDIKKIIFRWGEIWSVVVPHSS